jgi:hypothetical protein
MKISVIIKTLEWAIKFLDKWDLKWAKLFMDRAYIDLKKLINDTKTITPDNNTKS